MVVARSAIFMAALALWTIMMGIAALVFALMPRRLAYRLGVVWAQGVLYLLRETVGLSHRVRGAEHISETPVIYALKHQSAWETIALLVIVPPISGVLKRELLRIPIYGWYLHKMGMVPIDRGAQGAALRTMLRRAQREVALGRSLMIMPEGTRIAPGRTGRYYPGVAALYKYLDRPIVPVALNSGLFWGRRQFVKRPGVITIEFLEPIAPGLERDALMALLEERIETASERLRQEAEAEFPTD